MVTTSPLVGPRSPWLVENWPALCVGLAVGRVSFRIPRASPPSRLYVPLAAWWYESWARLCQARTRLASESLTSGIESKSGADSKHLGESQARLSCCWPPRSFMSEVPRARATLAAGSRRSSPWRREPTWGAAPQATTEGPQEPRRAGAPSLRSCRHGAFMLAHTHIAWHLGAAFVHSCSGCTLCVMGRHYRHNLRAAVKV